MSDVLNDARDAIEEELADLDIPVVMLDAAVMMLCDHLDMDPFTMIDAYEKRDEVKIADLKTAHGAKDVDLVFDMLGEGLESSTQIPHIRRAIELNIAYASL